MNIKFDSISSQKKWEITDEKIIYKGKEIPLSKITYVVHHAFKKTSDYGWIFISCGNGLFSPSYSLYYKESEIEQGEMVAEYLLRMIGNEQGANEILKQSENRKKKDEIKKEQDEIKTKEFKKRCNVCGNVFCYTWDDLKKNKDLQTHSTLNTVASFAGALSGYYAASSTASQTSHDLESRIIDYNKCPSCGSRDLVDITDEELTNNQQTVSTASTVDELKKFKELLDMGIITQEEFEAKKKQLLGL